MRDKGITTQESINNIIFHHTVIENTFEMLKSSEHNKLGQ